MHRVITRHLLGQAGLEADEADSGAVTLIQRFGSAANLNIHVPSFERPCRMGRGDRLCPRLVRGLKATQPNQDRTNGFISRRRHA